MKALSPSISEGGRSAVIHSVSPPSYMEIAPAHLWTRSSPLSMNSTLSVLPGNGLKHPVSFHRPDFAKPLPIWMKSGRGLSFSQSNLRKQQKTTIFSFTYPGTSGTDQNQTAARCGQFCLFLPFFGRPDSLYSIRV